MPTVRIQISQGGLAALDLLLAKWRPAVDQQAWNTLMALDSQAVDVLQAQVELEMPLSGRLEFHTRYISVSNLCVSVYVFICIFVIEFFILCK